MYFKMKFLKNLFSSCAMPCHKSMIVKLKANYCLRKKMKFLFNDLPRRGLGIDVHCLEIGGGGGSVGF
jgi:hypothetical protein